MSENFLILSSYTPRKKFTNISITKASSYERLYDFLFSILWGRIIFLAIFFYESSEVSAIIFLKEKFWDLVTKVGIFFYERKESYLTRFSSREELISLGRYHSYMVLPRSDGIMIGFAEIFYFFFWESFFDEFHGNLSLATWSCEKCRHPHLEHEILTVSETMKELIHISLPLFLFEIFAQFFLAWGVSGYVVREAKKDIHRCLYYIL